MRRFFILLVAALGMAVSASAADYMANDAAVDALIESAVEATSESVFSEAMAASDMSMSAVSLVSRKSDVAAIVIDFFLGGFGLHRHYMGTAPGMWAAYLFTLGGICGIIPFVDFIVMLVNVVDGSGLGEFYGNTRFLMWL